MLQHVPVCVFVGVSVLIPLYVVVLGALAVAPPVLMLVEVAFAVFISMLVFKRAHLTLGLCVDICIFSCVRSYAFVCSPV